MRASPAAPLRAEVSWTFEWRLSFGMAPADAYKTVVNAGGIGKKYSVRQAH
jgi:hypothetical protein